MPTACPGPSALARIGRGSDAGSCPPELAAHIERCPGCREFLERCAAGSLETLPAAWLRPGGPPHIDGFTIQRELGRGAMGVVYLAHRDLPRRPMALKLTPGGHRAGPQQRRQWLREAEAASAVRHPHVVTLYEASVTDDWFVLALEYVPGGTLADRLAEPLAPRHAVRMVEPIARAVHHIHRSGLLHLDLKPSNILLDGDADAGWDGLVPKVTDFGIARAAEPAATDTGGAGPGGTPSYMAPEQVTGPRKEMTVQADIHGLGAILYHLLTGRPPYQGATILDTIDQLRRQEPVPPRRMNPRNPRDIETICLKCLHNDPGRRYPSAEALADDLRHWLDGRPIAARPVSAAGKTWRWCRRRPVVAAMAAALLLTLSASIVTVILLWRRAEANFRLSNEILGELIDLSVGGEDNLPRIMTPGRSIPQLERNRRRLLALRVSGPDELSAARQLARVEGRLCECLSEAARHEDARTVWLQALARLDMTIRRHPQDLGLRGARWNCLMGLADVSEPLRRNEDRVIYLTRAVEACVEPDGWTPSAGMVSHLFYARRTLAWALWERGDHERAGALLASNHGLAERLAADSRDRFLAVHHLVSHIDWKVFMDVTISAQADGPGADPSVISCPLAGLTSPTDASPTPEEWARMAALAIHAAQAEAGRGAIGEAQDGHTVMGRLGELASRLRRWGEAAKARRISDRMLVLAKHFVDTCPDQPLPHLMVAMAYIQLSKGGWQTGHEDLGVVEANLTLALAAAQEAMRVAPGSESAQLTIETIRRKLAGLSPTRRSTESADQRGQRPSVASTP